MQSAGTLSGKTAIVTGGASGIGMAIARALAQQGAAVFIVDLNHTGAAEAARAIVASGGHAQPLSCDVSDSTSVRVAFDSAFQQGPVHILVNCAGVAHVGTAASTSEEDFDRILRIN